MRVSLRAGRAGHLTLERAGVGATGRQFLRNSAVALPVQIAEDVVDHARDGHRIDGTVVRHDDGEGHRATRFLDRRLAGGLRHRDGGGDIRNEHVGRILVLDEVAVVVLGYHRHRIRVRVPGVTQNLALEGAGVGLTDGELLGQFAVALPVQVTVHVVDQRADDDHIDGAGVLHHHGESHESTGFGDLGRIGRLHDQHTGFDIGQGHRLVVGSTHRSLVVVVTGSGHDVGVREPRVAFNQTREGALVGFTWCEFLRHRAVTLPVQITELIVDQRRDEDGVDRARVLDHHSEHELAAPLGEAGHVRRLGHLNGRVDTGHLDLRGCFRGGNLAIILLHDHVRRVGINARLSMRHDVLTRQRVAVVGRRRAPITDLQPLPD